MPMYVLADGNLAVNGRVFDKYMSRHPSLTMEDDFMLKKVHTKMISLPVRYVSRS